MQKINILQIIAIIILLFLLYLFYRFINSIKKSKRLEDYAISYDNEHFNIEYSLWKFIRFISKYLEKIKFLNKISKKYDKYINPDENKWKKSIDFITIKIIISIIFILIYIFEVMLHNLPFNWLLLIFMFLLGYFLPNIIYSIEYNYKTKYIEEDVLKAVIIMLNSYKANMNNMEAIDNVIAKINTPSKIEFIKVKNDIENGLDIGKAFKRMYQRTKNPEILKISNILSLVNKNDSNIIEAFEEIEKKIVNDNKNKLKIKRLKNFNQFIKIICIILPIVFLLFLSVIKIEYLYLIFVSKYNYLIISIIIISFIIYFMILNKLARR